MAIKNFEQLYSLSGDQILPKVQVINNLTSTDTTKPLAAALGKALYDEIFDDNGLVRSEKLPSYVDDIVEFSGPVAGSSIETGSPTGSITQVLWDTTRKVFVGKDSNNRYWSNWSETALFPAASHYGAVSNSGVVPVRNKIYVGSSIGFANAYTDKTYRWSGSDLVEISKSITLGETSSTAYAGDKGKAVTDKVNKMLNATWLSDFNDYTTSANYVTILAHKKVFDSNGNVVDYDGDDASVTLPSANTRTAGVMTAADKTALDNAAPKTQAAKTFELTGNSAVDGQYIMLKSVSGADLKEICIPVAKSSDETDSCGLMSHADKIKLDGITAITEAELNAILV